MSMRSKIRPYSHARTDGLYDAMMRYLAAHRAILQRAKAITEADGLRLESELVTYRKMFAKDNPHLAGRGGYTHTGIVMKAA